jgi:hypothetical protein
MVKYRRLNREELEELEDEFVKYLATQSISASDWVRIKNEDVERQDQLIDLFSTIVMERVLSKIEYVEIITEKEIKIFHMQENKGTLVGMKTNQKDIDFTDDGQLDLFFQDVNSVQLDTIEVYSLDKNYTKSRAEETFFLVEMGAQITDNKIFTLIESLLK